MLEFIAFFACLEFAMSNSSYSNIILKPKQVACLESLYLGKDVVCVLPTGYGKSLVFHLLPSLMFARNRSRETQIEFLKTWKLSGISTKDVSSIVIVVSPLNALINNQISRLQSCGIQASAISVKDKKDNIDNVEEAEDGTTDESYECDFTNLCEIDKLLDGYYNIVFAHPESLISTKFGRNLMLSKAYKKLTVAIVVDEAHCILDW